MPAPHRTRSAPRTLRVAVAALAVAACSMPMREVGQAPQGAIRAPESRADRLAREEARHAAMDRADEEREAVTTRVATTAKESAVRYGVAATLRFHTEDCDVFRASATAERVTFVSAWDALDAGYAPCPTCRPIPAR